MDFSWKLTKKATWGFSHWTPRSVRQRTLWCGFNTEPKIKRTPEYQLPVEVQGPPAPFRPGDEVLIEFGLLQEFNNMTTLSHSKHCSLIIFYCQSSGKLWVPFDSRRVNRLVRHTFLTSNFPNSIMTDATNHFAGKFLFCKLEWSQTYHCAQMANDLSVPFLAFNFASRTFAYNCFAQGLKKSVTKFGSFSKHYLDQCVATNVVSHFNDDIAAGVIAFDGMIPDSQKSFHCLRAFSLKLSAHKYDGRTTKTDCLGSTITS